MGSSGGLRSPGRSGFPERRNFLRFRSRVFSTMPGLGTHALRVMRHENALGEDPDGRRLYARPRVSFQMLPRSPRPKGRRPRSDGKLLAGCEIEDPVVGLQQPLIGLTR